jgi:hypothetical protein
MGVFLGHNVVLEDAAIRLVADQPQYARIGVHEGTQPLGIHHVPAVDPEDQGPVQALRLGGVVRESKIHDPACLERAIVESLRPIGRGSDITEALALGQRNGARLG